MSNFEADSSSGAAEKAEASPSSATVTMKGSSLSSAPESAAWTAKPKNSTDDGEDASQSTSDSPEEEGETEGGEVEGEVVDEKEVENDKVDNGSGDEEEDDDDAGEPVEVSEAGKSYMDPGRDPERITGIVEDPSSDEEENEVETREGKRIRRPRRSLFKWMMEQER